MRAVMAKMQARNVLIAIYFLDCQGGLVLTGWEKKGGEGRSRPAN
jgi:hypothetical protein